MICDVPEWTVIAPIFRHDFTVEHLNHEPGMSQFETDFFPGDEHFPLSFCLPGFRKHDGSRELQELRERIRHINDRDRRIDIQQAFFYTALHVEDDISYELAGLCEQNRDGHVPIYIYVLGMRHVETIYRRAPTSSCESMGEFVFYVRQLLLHHAQFHEHIELVFVDPQPPPYYTHGEDALHLIANLHPNIGGVPILTAILMRYYGEIGENPQMQSFRSRAEVTCQAILVSHEMHHQCTMELYDCDCTKDYENYQPRDILRLRKGNRVDLEAILAREVVWEQTALMQTDRPNRRIWCTAYVYRHNDAEPLVFISAGGQRHELFSYVMDTIHGSPSFDADVDHALFEVRPNPEDLQKKNIQGFLLEDRQRKAEKVVILLDVAFYSMSTAMRNNEPTPTDEWRAVEIIPSQLRRSQFLMEVGLAPFCQHKPDCLVTMMGIPWTKQDHHIWHIFDGAFAIVKIPLIREEVPLPVQWRLTQAGCSWEDVPRRWQEEQRRPQGGRTIDQSSGDDSSLFQLPSHTLFEFSPITRLPPPGNGKVAFSSKVTFFDSDDGGQQIDRAVTNDFVADFLQQTSTARRSNEFFEDYCKGLRFVPIDEGTPVGNLVGEVAETDFLEHFLPLAQVPHDTDRPIDATELPQSSNDTRQEPNQGRVLQLEGSLQEFESFLPLLEDQCQVDISHVIRFEQWISQHLTIPNFDVDMIRWKSESLPWIQCQPWITQPADALHFYIDGSHSSTGTGAAALLFPRIGDQWFFGGFVHHGGAATALSAYDGEIGAAVLSLKWAFDEIKLQHGIWGHTPEVHFHYDAWAAALGVFGQVGGKIENPRFVAARSLAIILRERWHIDVQTHHTKAHSRDPGNEAADAVANFAAKQTNPPVTFWDHLMSQEAQHALQWTWWLYSPDCQLHQGKFVATKPISEVNPKVCEAVTTLKDEQRDFEQAAINLKVATYNINTLGTNKKRGFIGKVEETMRQFHEEGVHIVCLQETRHRKMLSNANPWYSFIQSTADEKGHGGILVGLSKHHKINLQRRREGSLTKIPFKIVYKTHQSLIVKFDGDSIHAVLVTAHSPHTGINETEVQTWWKTLGDQVATHCQGWPIITAIDANARLGSSLSPHVGPHQAEEENWTGHLLHQYLDTSQSWAPATHRECQIGDGATFIHPTGKPSRIDFILLPLEWKQNEILTRVAPDLATGDCLFDHKPALLEMKGFVKARIRRKRGNELPKVDLQEPRTKQLFLQHMASTAQPIDWSKDIHTEAADFTARLQEAAKHAQSGISTQRPRKTYFSKETWTAIKQKQFHRRTYFSRKWHERKAFLRLFLAAWKKESTETHRTLLVRMRKEGSWAEEQFRCLANVVTKLVRKDDVAFYEDLSWKMKHKEDESAKSFWAEIKKYLPRYRDRRKSQDPKTIAALDSLWEDHMAAIEAAVPKELPELYVSCLAKQNCAKQADVTLSGLPTLIEVEQQMRKCKPEKAGGLDKVSSNWIHFASAELAKDVWTLAMKTAMWQTEAFQFKGGNLIMIPKAGPFDLPTSYRPIMLMSTIAKQIHSWYRPKLMQTITDAKEIGQIGGFPGQEPSFGSQFVRTVQKVAYLKGMSSGVIFLDLKTAFHSLIRQFVVGRTNQDEEEIASVLQNLSSQHIPTEAIEETLKGPGFLEKIGAPFALIRQLQEFGTQNWAHLYGHDLLTCKGTRPGSPIADALFHICMCEILNRLKVILHEDDETTAFFEQHDMPNTPVAWADDVALILVSRNNSQIAAKTASFAQKTSDLFREYGMQTNFAKKKTEILLTFVGSEAPKYRRQFMQQQEENHRVFDSSHQEHDLRFTSVYRHLGVQQTTGGHIAVEIRHRIAEGWQAWRTIARPILLNRKLPVATRLRLWDCLINTKIFFGSGAWPLLTRTQQKPLDTCYMKMLRQITGLHFKGKETEILTDMQVRTLHDFPSVRIRLAKERLIYASRVSKQAWPLLGQALKAEEECFPFSWMAGLKSDLRWFQAMSGTFWGVTFEETQRKWLTNSGWKSAVKRAVEKHVLLERLSTFLNTQRETPDESLCYHACECGLSFSTKVALAVHRWKTHQDHAIEYQFATTTACAVCLREYWTKQRLRQHLAYMPRSGKANRCFAWYECFFENASPDAEEEVPRETTARDHRLIGLRRKDFLQASGPFVLGMHPSDLQWAHQEIQFLEDRIHTMLHPFSIDEAFDDDFVKDLQSALRGAGEDWTIPILEMLEKTNKTTEANLLNMAMMWIQEPWPTREDAESFRALINDLEGDSCYTDWACLKSRMALVTRWMNRLPHRPVNTGPANESERSLRDHEISLPLHLKLEDSESLALSSLDTRFWDQIMKLIQPKSTVGQIRKVLAQVLTSS